MPLRAAGLRALIEDFFKPVTLAAISPVYLGFAGMGAEPTDASTAFHPVQATFADVRLEACPLPTTFRRGETNGDGQEDLSDAIALLGHLFLGAPEPPCLEAGDVDDSGQLDITDPIALLAYLFQGGTTPPESFGACGADPTPDGIGCEEGSCR